MYDSFFLKCRDSKSFASSLPVSFFPLFSTA